MITRTTLLILCLAATLAHAEEKKLDKVPLRPGAYRVDGKGSGFCRLGPGGSSLVIESGDALSVVTIDGNKVHVDHYLADGVTRLEGGFAGAALVAAGGGSKLTMTPEQDVVTLHLETAKQKTTSTWTRTTPTTPGVATGIGGVFMKAKDARKLRDWYQQHLGLPRSEYGFLKIRWRELDDPAQVATTVWATFKPESTHFDGPFMVNYRVDHLDALRKKLEKDGIKIERTEDEPGNGHFAWIRDGEGNLVELWEPPPPRPAAGGASQ